MGFMVDGKFIVCHQFQHANIQKTTYMTTACLSLRYEIENTNTTASSSSFKQICSTVLSEGGYQLQGQQVGIGTPIATPKNLPLASTYYPIISLRLRTTPARLDAIAIISDLSFMGISNNAHYNWRVVSDGTTVGGTWVPGATDSSVEYNITGTSFSGGRILTEGYETASNQSTPTVTLPRESLFKFQLERNTFTSTPFEITLTAAASVTNTDLYASMDWEEVLR